MIDDTMFQDPHAPRTPASEDAAPAAPPPASAAQVRFQSCRWRKPSEAGSAAYCTHRDVLPMAGKEGFSADSWCTDCTLYKAKRMPRKREEPQPDQPNNDWRYRY
jgi:hypothetical protein